MLQLGVSQYGHNCDRCDMPASDTEKLICLQTSRLPFGRKRIQFHAIYLCESCLARLQGDFISMKQRLSPSIKWGEEKK